MIFILYFKLITMKKIIMTLSLLSAVQFAISQDITMKLWDGEPPNFKKSDLHEQYDTTDIVRISHVSIPDMAVYLPSKEIATGQAVVICPGGGYRILAYNKEGTDFAKYFNAHGIAAIVLKYRLPDDESNVHPEKSPLMDAKRAIRLVRFNAGKWNINNGKVGIMGFSAGGHLASTLGTHFADDNEDVRDEIDKINCRPDFMILAYPVISFQEKVTHKGSRENLIGLNPDQDLINYYSNELQVDSDCPPTFLIHAQDDPAVPVQNSLLFYNALLEKGISAEMHIYPKGGHGFGFGYGKGQLGSWASRCLDWMKNLGGE